jgi:hypothetical protein
MVWFKRYLGGFALLTVAGGSMALCGAEDVKTPSVTKQLAGEWLLSTSQSTPDKALIIWTFKSDGIVRIDAIDPRSREKVREGPMVGRWRVKGDEIICTWEVWNDKQHRPTRGEEAEEWFRVRTMNKSELALEVVSRRGKPVAEGELLRYKRFSGWE